MPKKLTKGVVTKTISRSEMVKKLKANGGKFFTSTHIDKEGNPNTMNGILFKKQDSDLGYLRIYSLTDRGIRMINPQTITHLNLKDGRYKAPGVKKFNK